MSLCTRSNSFTKRQLVAMLDYFDMHEGMFSGDITPNFTKEKKNSLWEDLTKKLNAQHSEGKGSIKSVAKWQKSWNDWKYWVRRKFNDNLFKRGMTRPLNDLEFRALKMMERLVAKKKTSGDLDDDNDETDINEESSSREHGLSLTIEDVKSIESKPSTPVEEHSSPISFETIRVKGESSTSLASDSDTEIAESSTLIINDTPVSSMKETSLRDNKAIALRDSPRVVLRDIALEKTPSYTQTSTPNKSSSGTSFVPSVGMQHLVTVTPVITNDSLTHGMKNVSSWGTGSVISAETNSFAAGLLGMQIPEVVSDKKSTTKQSPEDTLGGLPLNLQNSILERLDTLNRNIETNTCALTMLSKAINDSADSQTRVINNLSKILTTIGNTIPASVDRLMGPPDQE